MELWTVTLLVVLCSILYYYLKKKSDYFKAFGIPYTKGWPFFGSMGPVLFRSKHFCNVILDLYRSHPNAKYFGTFDFTTPVIVLRDLDLIKSVGIKNFEDFPDHRVVFDDTVDPLFGANLFNIKGEKWKNTRNLLSPTFTSSKMKAMYELIVECAKNFNNYLAEQPRNSLDMLATKDLFTKYTNDVVATCAFGINVDTLKNPKNDFYVLGREATNLDGLNSLKFLLARVWPRVMKVLGIRFVSDRICKFFYSIISETINTRDTQGIKRPDMLQIMMDARGKDNKVTLDIPNITAQAFIFFFGGFDTTSTQMCIIAHELTIKPHIQKKLQREIDDVMEKTGGNPKYDDIIAMPYLDAVFNESMRRHSQGSVLDRVCTKAFELPPAVPGAKPFVVQPGMPVWLPSLGVHMDSKYYDNPEEFDPERYYQKKVTINDVYNLGFGIGPRGCIGNRFAILETKVLFFYLLARYNLVPNSKTCKKFEYSTDSFVIKPKGGYWLAVESRS